MTGFSEFSARAALCRQLAELEPDSENLWLAEAKRWSCLTQRGRSAAERLSQRAFGLYWRRGGSSCKLNSRVRNIS